MIGAIKVVDYIRNHKESWMRQWSKRTLQSFADEVSAALKMQVADQTIRRICEAEGFPPKREVRAAVVHYSTQARLDAIQSVVTRLATQLGVDASELEPFTTNGFEN